MEICKEAQALEHLDNETTHNLLANQSAVVLNAYEDEPDRSPNITRQVASFSFWQ